MGGHQIHAERVGDVLHFDFLYVRESTSSPQYILILKNDCSGYVFLRPTENADAASASAVLMKYFTTFVPVLQWFPGQGKHFCNELMQHIASSLGAKHICSTVYVLWSQGTVKEVCKEVLRVMRALNLDMRVAEIEWPLTVPAIQCVINNSTSRRLGNRVPIKVHTDMKRLHIKRH